MNGIVEILKNLVCRDVKSGKAMLSIGNANEFPKYAAKIIKVVSSISLPNEETIK